MPLARIGQKQLLFVHIPKTGGTSIECYLRAKGIVFLHGAPAWSQIPLQHLDRDAFQELAPAGAYDCGFAVLRDPKARLISEFRMRIEPISIKVRPLGWWRVARNRLAGRRTYAVRVKRRLEYLDFGTWVERVFRETRSNPRYQSNHIRPQCDFVDPAHKLFRFEDGLERVFRWIDATTETSPVSGDFHARRSADIEVICEPGTERRIREFYAEDYALIEGLKGAG